MKRIILVVICSLSFVGAAQAGQACDNFASYFAMNSVLNAMVLDGNLISENNFYPDKPELIQATESADSSVMKYQSVISVSPKSSPTEVLRYNVDLSVEDAGASCLLLPGSLKIEFEN